LSKRVLVLCVGLLALALLVAGCGSSDDSTTGDDVTASSLTKAEFIKKADAICEEAGEGIQEESISYAEENGIDVEKEPSDGEKEELVTEVIVPNIEKQAEDIAALGAPEGEEDQVGSIVEGIESAAAATAKDPGSVIEGDEGAFKSVNEEATEYGLKACGKG
jgi:hypothetical protein